MTTLVIAGPASISGSNSPPGDKSISHRSLMLGAVAAGRTTVRNIAPGADVASTMVCLERYGVRVERGDDMASVHSRGIGEWTAPTGVLDAGGAYFGPATGVSEAIAKPTLAQVEANSMAMIRDGLSTTMIVSEDTRWGEGQWINARNVFEVAYPINKSPPFENDINSDHRGGANQPRKRNLLGGPFPFGKMEWRIQMRTHVFRATVIIG